MRRGVVARGAGQQDGGAGGGAREVLDEGEGVVVGPVQVLQAQHAAGRVAEREAQQPQQALGEDDDGIRARRRADPGVRARPAGQQPGERGAVGAQGRGRRRGPGRRGGRSRRRRPPGTSRRPAPPARTARAARARAARAATSSSRRVFPIPASPATSSAPPRPAATASTSPRAVASSAVRPTTTGLRGTRPADGRAGGRRPRRQYSGSRTCPEVRLPRRMQRTAARLAEQRRRDSRASSSARVETFAVRRVGAFGYGESRVSCTRAPGRDWRWSSPGACIRHRHRAPLPHVLAAPRAGAPGAGTVSRGDPRRSRRRARRLGRARRLRRRVRDRRRRGQPVAPCCGAGRRAGASGVVVGAVRLARGRRPAAVLAGLLGVAVAVLVALYTGRAVDFFLLQIASNAASALAWAVSIAVRWPLLGLVVGRRAGPADALAPRPGPAARLPAGELGLGRAVPRAARGVRAAVPRRGRLRARDRPGGADVAAGRGVHRAVVAGAAAARSRRGIPGCSTPGCRGPTGDPRTVGPVTKSDHLDRSGRLGRSREDSRTHVNQERARSHAPAATAAEPRSRTTTRPAAPAARRPPGAPQRRVARRDR